ncbi:hypothetical protein ES703_45089 [subsurface metagenome]
MVYKILFIDDFVEVKPKQGVCHYDTIFTTKTRSSQSYIIELF